VQDVALGLSLSRLKSAHTGAGFYDGGVDRLFCTTRAFCSGFLAVPVGVVAWVLLHAPVTARLSACRSSLTCLRPFTVENGHQKPLVYGLANTNNAVLLYLIGGGEESPPPKHIDYCRCEIYENDDEQRAKKWRSV
jgi:hypothetical protein